MQCLLCYGIAKVVVGCFSVNLNYTDRGRNCIHDGVDYPISAMLNC
jgi:hypothetical protein